jgi:hypothetical protein
MQAEFQFFEKLLFFKILCRNKKIPANARRDRLLKNLFKMGQGITEGNPPGLQAEAFYWNSSSVLTISVSGIDSLFGIISPIS